MYYQTDQSGARHFSEPVKPEMSGEAEPLFLEELQRCPALSQQVQKSGVGIRFIYHEGGALLKGIGVLMKEEETRDPSLSLCHVGDTTRK